MKINENFIQRDVGGNHIIMAVGEEAAKLNGMITLNDTAYYIWQKIAEGLDRNAILNAMLADFESAPNDEIANDLDIFLGKLKEKNIISE